jgi:NTE family protein
VLDAVLADGRLRIDGISGTSAGAVNAVVVADGLHRGGPGEARTRLAEFWRALSVDGHLPDLQRRVVERLFAFIPGDGLWLDAISRQLSPYDLNPLNINPLKKLIERFVDFEAIRRNQDFELFISATNVHSGELRVFRRAEITPEVVMASACLPLLFRAVEIDGVAYWDGGYSGNPALTPFLRATSTEDVIIIQINPRERRKVPMRVREIRDRVTEISFNAALLSELRGIAFVNRLIDEGRLPRGVGRNQFRRLKLHRIGMEDVHESLGPGGTLKTQYEYFERLRKLGERATRRFLDLHFQHIGCRSTMDMAAKRQPVPVE